MARYWFISSRQHNGSKLALFTFILAFVVILLGAYTRLTDAGLACPDWPNCYGYITAPHTPSQLQNAAQSYPLHQVNVKKAWTEMVHRYFAGFEGILILLLSFVVLFKHYPHSSSFKITQRKWIGIALIALLCLQVILGMLTVTEKLKPFIVLAHLLTGLSLLSLLWWSYLGLQTQGPSFNKLLIAPTIPWFWGALFIVALQITLGGWTSTHNAGLACIDLPYCNGKWFPALHLQQLDSDLITIHMLHRIGALLTAIYVGALAIKLLSHPLLRQIALLLLSLLGLQLTLGILNVIWLRPVWIALSHDAVGILLLLTLMSVLVKFSCMDHRYG